MVKPPVLAWLALHLAGAEPVPVYLKSTFWIALWLQGVCALTIKLLSKNGRNKHAKTLMAVGFEKDTFFLVGSSRLINKAMRYLGKWEAWSLLNISIDFFFMCLL